MLNGKDIAGLIMVGVLTITVVVLANINTELREANLDLIQEKLQLKVIIENDFEHIETYAKIVNDAMQDECCREALEDHVYYVAPYKP